MSEHDYGQLETLKWAVLVNEIPVFGRGLHIIRDRTGISLITIIGTSETTYGSTDENDLSHIKLSIETGSPPKLLPYADTLGWPISKSPDHSWCWEALISILGEGSVTRYRDRIPGFPKRAVDLQCCSKSDLLNIAVNLIINGDALRVWFFPQTPHILRWLSLDRNDQLLRLIIRSPRRRIRVFAWNLIQRIHSMFLNRISFVVEQARAEAIIRLCYESEREVIRTDSSASSKRKRCRLLAILADLSMSSFMSELIESGVDMGDPYVWNLAITREDKSLMTVLLQHGASTQIPLRELFRRSLVSLKAAVYSTMPILVDHGADIDVAIANSFPFTIAQLCVFNTSNAQMHQRVLEWTKDSFTRRIINLLSNHASDQAILAFSTQEKEFILLAAAGVNNLALARDLLVSGVDSNCAKGRATIQNAYFQRNRYFGVCPIDYPEVGECRPPRPLVEVEITKGVEKQSVSRLRLKSPAEMAVHNHNGTLLKILLERGASLPPATLVRLFIDSEGDVNLLQPSLSYLCSAELLPTFSHYLLFLAIRTSNFPLLDSVIESGADLKAKVCLPQLGRFRYSPIKWVNPFMFALVRSDNMHMIHHLWERGARFLHNGPSAGSQELILLCSSALGESHGP